MKKVNATILAAAVLFTFGGCSLLNKAPSGEGSPSAATTTGTVTASGGGTQTVETENKVELSIDKKNYDREERIEVTLNFGKLNQDSAVIVIVNSDAAHGSEAAVHEDNQHEEYRWLADFSELPFYLWGPNKDGLFDVRVYADRDGGEELASVTFAVGEASLAQDTVVTPPNDAENGWFTDEVLAEMKLTGFTKPEGFELLTAEELPDAMENEPYLRCLKGAADYDEYLPIIDNAVDILNASYGEIYGWVYHADGSSEYKVVPQGVYGDTMYVYDGDTIRSVTFIFSTMDGVDSKVLRIGFNPNSDDPR